MYRHWFRNLIYWYLFIIITTTITNPSCTAVRAGQVTYTATTSKDNLENDE
jgi:hypothetical protein